METLRPIAYFAFAIFAIETQGYPTGAPVIACDLLVPNHYTNQNGSQVPVVAQKTVTPYRINVPSKTYSKGKTLNITINSTLIGAYFQGFILQARKVGDKPPDIVPVGVFSNNMPANITRCLACHSDCDSLTHNQTADESTRVNMTSVNVTWTPPETDMGPIEFVGTVLKVFDTFWNGSLSMQLQPAGYDSETNGQLKFRPTFLGNVNEEA